VEKINEREGTKKWWATGREPAVTGVGAVAATKRPKGKRMGWQKARGSGDGSLVLLF